MDAFINDTIVCDTTLLNGLTNNSNYDYNSDLNVENESILQKFFDSIAEFIDDLFHKAPNPEDSIKSSLNGNSVLGYVLIAVIVIVLLALLYYMYKKKMFFFKKKEKEAEEYEVVEDTIYGVDFENDIALAVKAGNYKEAIRLRYLQCLRLLSDKSLINWRIYKTPTQYTYEFKNDTFDQFTKLYVFIRYGGYAATEIEYDEICKLKTVIEKHVDDMTPPPTTKQEGGDYED